jgi:hypothetical protein
MRSASLKSDAPRNHHLHALCPYFAMFPPEFARSNILRYTGRGDLVCDPFSGRGTTPLEALIQDRGAIASDVNPVAYCVSAAKANVPEIEDVLDELDRLDDRYYRTDVGRLAFEASELPRFFRKAFTAETLRQLLFLRSRLDWRDNAVHRFIGALTLGHLHGESEKSPSYCSAQMPHSISTKPRYSLRYWRTRKLRAPKRDVFELLRDRADYRLAEGAPRRSGHVECCDVREARDHFRGYRGRVQLIVTSPPYLDTTRFEEDQWLRLWLLGGPPRPTYHQVSTDDRYESASKYWDFLQDAWRGVAPLLRPDAVIVCRLGARGVGPEDLRDGFGQTIRAVWPQARLLKPPAITTVRNRQMTVLLPDSVGCRFEIDFTFRLAAAR